MERYGWRIPFLIAGMLGLVGLYIRLRLETPRSSSELRETGEVAEAPLREAITTSWRPILQIAGLVVIHNVGFYIVFTFLPSYFTKTLESTKTNAFVSITVASLVALILIFRWCALRPDRPQAAADRRRRRLRRVRLSAVLAAEYGLARGRDRRARRAGRDRVGVRVRITGCGRRVVRDAGALQRLLDRLQRVRRPVRRDSALHCDVARRPYRQRNCPRVLRHRCGRRHTCDGADHEGDRRSPAAASRPAAYVGKTRAGTCNAV